MLKRFLKSRTPGAKIITAIICAILFFILNFFNVILFGEGYKGSIYRYSPISLSEALNNSGEYFVMALILGLAVLILLFIEDKGK